MVIDADALPEAVAADVLGAVERRLMRDSG